MAFTIFTVCLGLLLAYRIILIGGLLLNPKHEKEEPAAGLSLIICARNEAKNLEKHLPLWLEQTHPVLEIIVVDDGSTDSTPEVLKHFSGIKGVRIAPEEKKRAGKKQALELGIAVATHEVIAVTDADCTPATKQAMWSLHAAMDESDEVVIGYAPLHRKNTFLASFQRFETWLTGLRSMGMARLAYPYMGVGRNMLYRRSLYERVKDLLAYQKGIGGDDDLLINCSRPRPNAQICLDSECFIYSDPARDWKIFFRKKRRHISSSGNYHPVDQIWLTLLGVLPLLVLIMGGMLLWQGQFFTVAFGLVLYFILQWPATGLLMRKMKESDLIPIFPILELTYWLYLVIMIPVSMYKPPREW